MLQYTVNLVPLSLDYPICVHSDCANYLVPRLTRHPVVAHTTLFLLCCKQSVPTKSTFLFFLTMNSIHRFFCQTIQTFSKTSTPFSPLFQQQQQQQVRFMSKYMSKSARKRMPLTTKRASRGGYYKGKGGTKEGRLTSKGKFIVDPTKQLELIVPDLTGFKLKPYIAASVPKYPPEKQRNRVPTAASSSSS